MPHPELLPNAEQEYARLDALLEAVPLAVAVFDGQLVLAATNARYRDLTGVDVSQAVGRSVYDAFPNALADLTEQVDIAAGGVPVVAVRVPFQYRGGRSLPLGALARGSGGDAEHHLQRACRSGAQAVWAGSALRRPGRMERGHHRQRVDRSEFPARRIRRSCPALRAGR